ncbi:uncharacterized protein LOC133745085 isoform X1 [Rosa rugosa]|nr:uncharacterized protein LOC133745085 isoform X1 [Rosa rugosa]XP_062029070.1 uncharacterized protein LOC133745085 isoform X1 [Rosa rugosa]XP_062029075.1 uncharacterized protein LOC133745085 isoform X1 [Rosa rugosa]
MGNKIDLLTAKLMEDKPRKLQDIGPFTGCRDLYDDDVYLIAFVFLEKEDLDFRIFQTDYEHLDRLAMKCLEPGGLVTSQIINAAVSLLRDPESSTWYYTTCFSDRAINAAKKGGNDLLEFAATAPKRFASILQYRKGLKNGEKIFIPILDPDTTPNHWFFIVIKLARTDVEIWDTYPNPARTMARNDLVYYVLLALDTIFDTEIQSCFKKGWSLCSFTVFNVDDIHIQQNNFDCGIFMLRYIINYDNPLKDELDSVNRRVQLALWMLKHPKNQAWVKINEALDNENKNDGAKNKIKTIEAIDEATGNSVDQHHGKSCSKVVQRKTSTLQARGRGRPRGAKNKNSRK